MEFVVSSMDKSRILASWRRRIRPSKNSILAGKLGGPADFRLRHSDFSGDGKRKGIPWLGMPIADLAQLDRVLVVGSFLRKDHPLIAQRLRQAAKRGTQIHVLHSVDDDWLMNIASKKIVAPSEILSSIASFSEVLKGGKNAAILLGNFAQQHPQAAAIHAAAQAIGVKVGFLGEAANSVGGYVAGLPAAGGMPEVSRRKSLVLLGLDDLDLANPNLIKEKQFIVNLTSFKSNVGDVLLPIAPFTETPGTFISTEGRVQGFHAAVRPLGEARPAWKVLRVLGTMLGLPGFDYETVEQVRDACLAGRDVQGLLSNRSIFDVKADEKHVRRHSAHRRRADLLRRSAGAPLAAAAEDARRAGAARLDEREADAVAGRAGRGAGAGQAGRGCPAGEAGLAAALDDKLPDGCVRIAAGHASTAQLGPMFGAVTLEKITAQQAA